MILSTVYIGVLIYETALFVVAPTSMERFILVLRKQFGKYTSFVHIHLHKRDDRFSNLKRHKINNNDDNYNNSNNDNNNKAPSIKDVRPTPSP